MNRKEIVDIILKEKIVAVIRLKEQHEVAESIRALVAGGIKVLEVTSNTPGYLQEIEKARKLYPDTIIGAGTISNPRLAQDAINAGAQFLVSPNTSVDVVNAAHTGNIPVLMGAMTPTEVGNAVEAGADVIKLFPAGNMGLDYFKAVRGPFDSVKFFAVGGIRLTDVQDWLEAGAVGFGIGGNLTKAIRNEQDFDDVVATAKEFISLVQ